MKWKWIYTCRIDPISTMHISQIGLCEQIPLDDIRKICLRGYFTQLNILTTFHQRKSIGNFSTNLLSHNFVESHVYSVETCTHWIHWELTYWWLRVYQFKIHCAHAQYTIVYGTLALVLHFEPCRSMELFLYVKCAITQVKVKNTAIDYDIAVVQRAYFTFLEAVAV